MLKAVFSDLPKRLHVSHDTKPDQYSAVIVTLHGLGGSGEVWRHAAEKAPASVRVISIDLLGFGKSPKPKNASYNLRNQARSVASTLVLLGLRRKVVIVGHSLGALVAIELAKRYPLIIKGLVLISPPIYTSLEERNNKLFGPESFLLGAFGGTSQWLEKNPQRYLGLTKLVKSLGLQPPGFELNEQTVEPYYKALQASVIEQNSYKDILDLKRPIFIVYGSLDPFIVASTLKKLRRKSPYIRLKSIVALHEIRPVFYPAIDEALSHLLPENFARPKQPTRSDSKG